MSRLELYGRHLLLAGVCAGIAAANATRIDSSGLVAAALLAAVALAVTRRRGPVLMAALVLAGWWWGSARLDAIDRSPLSAELGRVVIVRAVVTGPSRRSTYGVRVPGRTEEVEGRPVHESVLLRLPVGRSPPQGALLEVVAKVKRPRGPEDGFDERTWLRRHGVHVVLSASSSRLVGRRGGLGGLSDRIRGAVATAVGSGVAGERRAVLLGIVLGEDEGLSRELRDRFRASGLYHLLAVSGQNVALVAGGVLLLAWLLGIPRIVGQVAALGAIGAYVLAVGPQPSVVRAGVAGALASLAWICARERDRWWFMLVGALVLLGWSPYALLDPGFQLSFTAVVAIFTVVPWLLRRLDGYPLPRPVAGTVAVAAACGLATAPIVLVQFGAVPLYSVLANALAAPVVAPLLGLGLAAAALHPALPDVAALLGWLDGWLAAYLVACARVVSSLPHARLETRPALLVAVVAIALGLVLRLPRHRRFPAIAAGVCLAWLLVDGWHPGGSSPPPPPSGLRITFLDVGQGDATLVQAPGAAVLVDEGPPEAHADRQVHGLGVRSLSAVVLTHPQRDHVGGAAAVVGSTAVQTVLEPHLAATVPEQEEALTEARRRGDRIVVARQGEMFRIGELRVRVLWPDGPGLESDDPNDHAIVLLVSYRRIDALLAADAESNVLLPLALPPVEVLKVSHHGSEDPGLPDLLRRLRPRVAVISVGAGNDYGHPRPATLTALAASPGLRVYRTDRDGAVTVESSGHDLRVATER